MATVLAAIQQDWEVLWPKRTGRGSPGRDRV